MKTSSLVLALSAALAFPALAQDEERPRRPARPDAAPTSDVAKGAPSVLAALDRNRDGKLDQREIDMAVVALRGMDRDDDGVVTAEEMVAPPRRRGGPGGSPPGGDGGDRPQQRRGFVPDFSSFDKDDDGKISKAEAPDRMKERFDQIDSSGDGFIDKAEQEALVKMLRERFSRQPGSGQGRRDQPDGGSGETDKPKRPPVEE